LLLLFLSVYIWEHFFNPELELDILINLYFLSEILNQSELKTHCENALVSTFNDDNVFYILAECAVLNLPRMIDYVIWYIVTNKIPPSEDDVDKLTPYLPVLTKYIKELTDLSLSPPPPFSLTTVPLRETLENLFNTGFHSDCTIWIKNEAFQVHSYILDIFILVNYHLLMWKTVLGFYLVRICIIYNIMKN